MGELNHVIVGPGGERVWTDDVGAKGAVRVSFHIVPYVGEYPGDPRDGKPTRMVDVKIDETKQPNYAVWIPEYSSRGLGIIMRDSMPETGLQPGEFDLVSKVIAESIMDGEPGKVSELGALLGRTLSLPQKLSPEEFKIILEKIENWKPEYGNGPAS